MLPPISLWLLSMKCDLTFLPESRNKIESLFLGKMQIFAAEVRKPIFPIYEVENNIKENEIRLVQPDR